ncbi:MAG: hypothetical protein GDA55_02400 [Cellvibrionales bacterium]|nr:hypothetical protein [Cellvibrionales bacterium]
MDNPSLTKQDVSRMADLLDKHGEPGWAQYLRELLDLKLDSMDFIEVAGGGSVWGGAGSLIDVALCTSKYPEKIRRRDAAEFFKLLGKLARHLVNFDCVNLDVIKIRIEDHDW